jgi:hypothetical protein
MPVPGSPDPDRPAVGRTRRKPTAAPSRYTRPADSNAEPLANGANPRTAASASSMHSTTTPAASHSPAALCTPLMHSASRLRIRVRFVVQCIIRDRGRPNPHIRTRKRPFRPAPAARGEESRPRSNLPSFDAITRAARTPIGRPWTGTRRKPAAAPSRQQREADSNAEPTATPFTIARNLFAPRDESVLFRHRPRF